MPNILRLTSGVVYPRSASGFAIDAGGYLNFGTTLGSAGYGIRDNAGTIEASNSGGAWASVGASGAPTGATYILQTANGSLGSAQALGALATGILKSTTTTGVVSVAVAGDFPTLNQNTSGTASNLSGTPALPNGTTATTQAAGDSSTKLATNSFVTTAVANAIAAVNPAVAVGYATTTNLPNTPVYNNGVAGIGATLTTATLNTALVIDGHTMVLADRLLVKNETAGNAPYNGIYSVTQAQGVGLAWILTRVLDFDAPSDMNNTGAIPVINGTVNTATQWVMSSSVATVGTDAVTFTKFSVNPTTVLTTAAAVTVAQGGTGLATLTANNVILGNGASNPTFVAPSSSGNLLTSNGTTWQSTAPAAAPVVISAPQYTDFGGGTARSTTATSNAGTVVFSAANYGVALLTSATATSGSYLRWLGPSNSAGSACSAEVGSPIESFSLVFSGNFGTDFNIYYGMGNYTTSVGGLIDYTIKHIGFKVTRAASGTASLYGTQADGVTESATAALTTVTSNDTLMLYFKVNGTSSVDYYYSKNGAAWSSATNLTGHMPTGVTDEIDILVSNTSTASATTIYTSGARYER